MKKEIIEKLATWIKENEKIPRTREMALKNGLPSANTIKRHFSSVEEALEKTLKHINLMCYLYLD